jgi:hypothetical protein
MNEKEIKLELKKMYQHQVECLNEALVDEDLKSFNKYLPLVVEGVKAHYITTLKELPEFALLFEDESGLTHNKITMTQSFIAELYPLVSMEYKEKNFLSYLKYLLTLDNDYIEKYKEKLLNIAKDLFHDTEFKEQQARMPIYRAIEDNSITYDILFMLSQKPFKEDIRYYTKAIYYVVASDEDVDLENLLKHITKTSLENTQKALSLPFAENSILYLVFYESSFELYSELIQLGGRFLNNEIAEINNSSLNDTDYLERVNYYQKVLIEKEKSQLENTISISNTVELQNKKLKI